eukprot:GFUD01025746.1.p1 GENE.GFUD01025746.1~~GFUD01025746.1.p1  ORF type:complete len:191 (+),score=49.70 GFUD01025746.1:57-629(+)
MALRLVKTCSIVRVSVCNLLKTTPVFQVSSYPSSSQFKSSISIDKIYPDSKSVQLSQPEQLESGFNGFIPIKDVEISYSSNNVGEDTSTSTKVDIRFHVESASWLPSLVKSKILENLGSDLTRDGWLVAKSDRTRSRTLNQADALEKLRTNIREALEHSESPFTALDVEKARKERLKAARERLHIKIVHQ